MSLYQTPQPNFPGFGTAQQGRDRTAAGVRTRSVFGLKVPERAVYSALAGLQKGPEAGAGFFANALQGFTGAVGGGLSYDQNRKSEDERRAVAEQKMLNDELDRRQKQAQLDEEIRHNTRTEDMAAAKPVGQASSPYADIPWYNRPDLDPATKQFAESYKKHLLESGQQGGLTGGDLTPEAQDMLARNFAMTGNLPAMGMGAAGTRVKILNKAASNFPKADIGANRAQYQADQKSLGQLQPMQSMASAMTNMTEYNVKQLEEALPHIPNYGNQPMNFAARKFATAMGNPYMSKFNTAREVVKNEYARFLSTLGQGSAILPEGARKDMGYVLDEAQTPEQILAAIKVLRQDAKNKLNAINQTLGGTQKRLRGFEAAGGNLYGSQSEEVPAGAVSPADFDQ